METGPTNNRPQWLPLFNGQAEEYALDFGSIFSIFQRRGWIISGSIVLGIVRGGILGRARPNYQAEFQLLTNPLTAESQVVSSLRQSVDVSGGSSTTSDSAPSKGLDATKTRLLLSRAVLDLVLQQVNPEYPDLKFTQLVKSLDIKVVPDTEIVIVQYSDSNSGRLSTVLNALNDRYISYSLEKRRAETNQGLKFIDSQLPELQSKVRSLQQRLPSSRQQYTFFDPESQNREISDQLSDFRKQHLDNGVQLKQARALYTDLQKEIAANRADRTAGIALRQSQGDQRLIDQILVVDGKIAQDGSIYLPDRDDMKILRDERARIVALIGRESTRAKDEVGSQVRDFEAKDIALDRVEQDLSQRMRDLSGLAREYTDIQAKLQIATENLKQFLAKKSTLQINNGQQVTPWQSISPPSNPELTSVKSDAILGAVLGLLLGIGLASVIDRSINVFYGSEGIKKASPQQHYRLGLSNQQGLSDVLLSNLDASEFIQSWAINPNVHVLTAGPISNYPITLLASQKMKQLMDRCVQDYDLVIYDKPPIAGLSDALLVAAHVDGLILVTRIKKTKRAAVQQTIDGLKFLPNRGLGIVANDSRTLPRISGYPLSEILLGSLPPPTPSLTPRA